MRDTADMIVRISSANYQSWGRLYAESGRGAGRTARLFYCFYPSGRCTRALHAGRPLSAHLAFRGGKWHEIAHGTVSSLFADFLREYRPFRRKIFTSNLRGCPSGGVLNCRRPDETQRDVQHGAMETARQALTQLAAQPAQITRFQFDMLDGRWWNSQRRVPEKYLRCIVLSDGRYRSPTAIPRRVYAAIATRSFAPSLARYSLARWRKSANCGPAIWQPRLPRTIAV